MPTLPIVSCATGYLYDPIQTNYKNLFWFNDKVSVASFLTISVTEIHKIEPYYGQVSLSQLVASMSYLNGFEILFYVFRLPPNPFTIGSYAADTNGRANKNTNAPYRITSLTGR